MAAINISPVGPPRLWRLLSFDRETAVLRASVGSTEASNGRLALFGLINLGRSSERDSGVSTTAQVIGRAAECL
jgi:hypothetical protein